MQGGTIDGERRSSWSVCALVGTLLGLIGLRYLLVPESAARTFGVPGRPAGHELHYIIGLRNLWLGALAVGLAALRQWHGLALWFAIGGFVCFADARLVANATGKLPQVAFHLGCGALGWCSGRRLLAERQQGALSRAQLCRARIRLGIVLKTGDKHRISPYKGAATIPPPPPGARMSPMSVRRLDPNQPASFAFTPENRRGRGRRSPSIRRASRPRP